MNSPTPAAARIALTKASATGLRSTLAIPGRASSSEEICDPPSSAGIGRAAPALKVAPSYYPPPGPSRIPLPLIAHPQGETAPRQVGEAASASIDPPRVQPARQIRREPVA